jgi:hypothetical protein
LYIELFGKNYAYLFINMLTLKQKECSENKTML